MSGKRLLVRDVQNNLDLAVKRLDRRLINLLATLNRRCEMLSHQNDNLRLDLEKLRRATPYVPVAQLVQADLPPKGDR